MSDKERAKLEDAIYDSNLTSRDKVILLQTVKERRESDMARERAMTLNRILACVLQGMHLEHGDGVVMPVTPEAVKSVSAHLESSFPVITLNSLADGGAEVSLTWEPR